MRIKHTLLAMLVTAIALAAMGGAANASRSIDASSLTWNERSSAISFEAGGITVRCAATLTLTLHNRPIPKTLRALIGFGEIRVGGCEGGTARVPPLTYHVQYGGFIGVLPNITAIVKIFLRLEILLGLGFFGDCLYEGDLALQTAPGTEVTTMRIDESRPFGFVRRLAGIACPSTMTASGTFTLTAAVGLRLI